jgi:hypothetical protein
MGVLWDPKEDLRDAEALTSEIFGRVDHRTEPIPFERYSDYYENEIGKGLLRCFWSFASPIQRGALVEVKLATNRIERATAKSGNRVVNLDPGLLTPEALSLATTKPYYHRIYLSKGIYAELTLVYKKGGFEPLPWTYPDYREDSAREFFGILRAKMLKNGKEARGQEKGAGS